MQGDSQKQLTYYRWVSLGRRSGKKLDTKFSVNTGSLFFRNENALHKSYTNEPKTMGNNRKSLANFTSIPSSEFDSAKKMHGYRVLHAVRNHSA